MDSEAFGLIDTAGFNEKKLSTGPSVSYDRLEFSESSNSFAEQTFEKLLVQSDGEIILSKDMLRKLSHNEVLVRKHPPPKRNIQFYIHSYGFGQYRLYCIVYTLLNSML